MDFKSKLSDRNNMVFYFCSRDFFIPAQNQYYNKNLNQDLEFIDILFDGKFPHLDTPFLMGFQN